MAARLSQQFLNQTAGQLVGRRNSAVSIKGKMLASCQRRKWWSPSRIFAHPVFRLLEIKMPLAPSWRKCAMRVRLNRGADKDSGSGILLPRVNSLLDLLQVPHLPPGATHPRIRRIRNWDLMELRFLLSNKISAVLVVIEPCQQAGSAFFHLGFTKDQSLFRNTKILRKFQSQNYYLSWNYSGKCIVSF